MSIREERDRAIANRNSLLAERDKLAAELKACREQKAAQKVSVTVVPGKWVHLNQDEARTIARRLIDAGCLVTMEWE